MSNITALPKLNFRREAILNMRKKRDELIKKRERLGHRVQGLDKMIAMYEKMLEPAALKREEEFWEAMKEK